MDTGPSEMRPIFHKKQQFNPKMKNVVRKSQNRQRKSTNTNIKIHIMKQTRKRIRNMNF